eukprot:gene10760-13174_t
MNKYTVVKLIGAGGEAKALLVKKNGTELLYVMKQRNFLNLEQANDGLNEAMSLAKIQNPNIVKFEEVFIISSGECYNLCIVMEYCDGGDLMEFMFNTIFEKENQQNQQNNNNNNSKQPPSQQTSANNLCPPTTETASLAQKIFYGSNSTNSTASTSSMGIECSTPVVTPMISMITQLTSPAILISDKPSQNNLNTSKENLAIKENGASSSGNPIPVNGTQKENGAASSSHQLQQKETSNPNLKNLNNNNNNSTQSISDLPEKTNNEQQQSTTTKSNTNTNINNNSITNIINTNSNSSSSSSSNSPVTSSPTEKKKKASSFKWFNRKSKSKEDVVEHAHQEKVAAQASTSLQNLHSHTQHSNSCSPSSSSSPHTTSAAPPPPPEKIKPQLPKKILYNWIYQIALGVQAIHSAHFIHRDLKSENIFLSDYHIKIGDFGLATKFESNIKGIAGTYYYSSPEVLQNQYYCRPADIFSLGCIFYEMVTLNLLPISKRCIAEEIIAGTFDSKKFLLEFPEEHLKLGELILQMVHPKPEYRPSIDLIVDNKIFEKIRFPQMTNGFSPEVSPSSPMAPPVASYGGYRKQLDRTEIPAAASILAESFVDDARFRYLSGEATADNPITLQKAKEDSARIRQNFFEGALKVMFSERFIIWGYYTADSVLAGVACWMPAEKKKRKIPLAAMIFKVITMIPKLGIRTMKKMKKLMTVVDKTMDKSGFDGQQYVLGYIGIAKHLQNKGIGRYLMTPVLEWADYSSKRCRTVCFTQRSINFLQKIGFETIYEQKEGLPRGLEVVWILQREPRSR